MGKKRIAINGFGRIGRLVTRVFAEREDIEVVAINDTTDTKTMVHLFKYDSAQGKFKGEVEYLDEDKFLINGNEVRSFATRNPLELPWKDLGIDIVVECTGAFRTKEGMNKHIEAGAKKVVLSAPAKGDGVKTIVLGVNDELLDESDQLLYSCASCTTNCLAPVIKIIDQEWGLERGSMTTIHAYTADQRIQDSKHPDLRRARAGAANIVPTTTGAATALGKVYPSAKGKLFAIAVRVPVITGSMIELNVKLSKSTSIEEVNAKFKGAAASSYAGILEYTDEPIVSSDIIGNKHSSIFDADMTRVLEGDLLKVVSWYDNEWGYSERLADLVSKV